MESGQYNPAWHYIHMLPEEVLMAAKDLKARRMLPVHNSKLALARHPCDEPLAKISELNRTSQIKLARPMIGEIINLDDPGQTFSQWWKSVK